MPPAAWTAPLRTCVPAAGAAIRPLRVSLCEKSHSPQHLTRAHDLLQPHALARRATAPQLGFTSYLVAVSASNYHVQCFGAGAGGMDAIGGEGLPVRAGGVWGLDAVWAPGAGGRATCHGGLPLSLMEAVVEARVRFDALWSHSLFLALTRDCRSISILRCPAAPRGQLGLGTWSLAPLRWTCWSVDNYEVHGNHSRG